MSENAPGPAQSRASVELDHALSDPMPMCDRSRDAQGGAATPAAPIPFVGLCAADVSPLTRRCAETIDAVELT